MRQCLLNAHIARGLADHQGQFDLPIKGLGVDGHVHCFAFAHHRVARWFHEEKQALVFFFGAWHAHFSQMIKVIGPGAQNFPRIQKRCQALACRQGVGRLDLAGSSVECGQGAGPITKQAQHTVLPGQTHAGQTGGQAVSHTAHLQGGHGLVALCKSGQRPRGFRARHVFPLVRII